ncbi:MAG: protein phosphatase CheZ [Alphaproteobacteria bacterium]|nr:protein phosphatase CheZ [Rhodospirillales bacterium]MCW9046358.1 protein phosphatase CheZ [Alphaproteobacteria bacterium]
MTNQGDDLRAKRIEAIRERYGDHVPVELLADVAGELLAVTKGGMSSETDLFSDLRDLANYIHEARMEIASLRPDEVGETLIPSATDELDAIVEATATATNSIMDATEEIENACADLDQDMQNGIMDITSKIYEACTFQDITGQRITKVVTALKNIEDKVDGLVEAFSDEIEAAKAEQKIKDDANQDVVKVINEKDDLLEGPQLAGQGSNQSDVDALLASFD